ncbi:hypothetical protein BDQ17DRAFT_1237536 [Cyathus striatus]|nr:hypothetical protein BDQ17DRAFT_1237536 [Cyathus striatus]
MFRPEDDSIDIILEPLQTCFLQPDPLGWTSYLHPEGVLYFCHTEKRVYTDANLYDDIILFLVNKSIDQIYQFLDSNSIVLSPMADLVLDLIDNQIQYYFADHRSRTVFYLDKMKTSDFPSWYEVQGASSLSHFRYLVESEYWWHVFLFPSSLVFREEIVGELRDLIINGIGDTMTCPYSTVTYSNEDLHKLLGVINSMERGLLVVLILRFMWEFNRGRFLHWHGQPAVRLSRVASVHTIVKERPTLIKIIFFFLFSAPEVHLQRLEKVWVDRLMYEGVWIQITRKLISEWNDFILCSTVLLTTNISFLAIQTIDQNNHPYRSPGQVSSYLSTVASIGSIVLGLILVQINRQEDSSAQEAWDFLTERAHPKYGLAVLSIVYSLPYLLWVVIFFLISVAWMCMADADISTRILTGLAWLVFAILTFLCLWVGRGPQPAREISEDNNSDAFTVGSGHSGRSEKGLGFGRRIQMLRLPGLGSVRKQFKNTAAPEV